MLGGALKLIERLSRKRAAYRRLFLSDDKQLRADAELVLADLAAFASLHAGPTVVSPITRQVDPLATHQRIGRGEVLQRIWRMTELDINKLHTLQEDEQ